VIIANVAVVEHRDSIKQDLKDKDAGGRGPDRRDDAGLNQHGQNDLDRMDPHASGHVEVEIGMMQSMYSPQCWYRVNHYVLQINRQIQQNLGCDSSAPVR
jgi:hypothetical protein